MQPGQAHKVQPRTVGDAALLNRIPVFVKDRQLDQAEVKLVARGLDDTGDTSGLQTQFQDHFGIIAVL
jgi:hypothetical protein